MRVVVEDGGEPLPPSTLRQPLLHAQHSDGGATAAANGGVTADDASPAPSPRCGGGCSTTGGVANIVVTAVGAGMVALPRAVSETGILVGMALFCLTAVLTFASTRIIITYAAHWQMQSFSELVRFHFGRTGATILQLAIITHVGGVMIGYCVIVADVLVGSAPAYSGVLPTLLARHDGPWWLSRPAVLGACLAGLVAPMLVPRTLAGVARFSRFSVGMVLLLAATICSLAAAAAAQGRVAPGVRLLPDPAHMRGGGALGVAASLLTVVSVGCLAFTCHFNLLPVKRSLKDPSAPHMLRVVQLALAVCAVVYAGVAICGYLLFGPETDGDVLKNLTATFVSTLLPPTAAAVVVYVIALSFTFNLLVNFVLKVWAVRENVCDLALGLPAHRLASMPFYGITAALVAAAYGISIYVPSIYSLLALVGSTACVTFSLFFPAAMVLKTRGGWVPRAGASSLIALGAAMAAMAVYNQLHGRGE